ncbi:hypothetical protein D3C87_1989910 [compost metagenome]
MLRREAVDGRAQCGYLRRIEHAGKQGETLLVQGLQVGGGEYRVAVGNLHGAYSCTPFVMWAR